MKRLSVLPLKYCNNTYKYFMKGVFIMRLINNSYTSKFLNVSFYELGNLIIRHSQICNTIAKCRDETLKQHNIIWESLRKTMRIVSVRLHSIRSMLTRRPAMLPMLGAIGTIPSPIRGRSTAMSTIPLPTPTPTMVRVWSLLKPIHKDSRVLRQFSITAKSGSFIGTYSFDSNKNNMREYHKGFLHCSSLAKIMAKYYPPQGGLVG